MELWLEHKYANNFSPSLIAFHFYEVSSFNSSSSVIRRLTPPHSWRYPTGCSPTKDEVMTWKAIWSVKRRKSVKHYMTWNVNTQRNAATRKSAAKRQIKRRKIGCEERVRERFEPEHSLLIFELALSRVVPVGRGERWRLMDGAMDLRLTGNLFHYLCGYRI